MPARGATAPDARSTGASSSSGGGDKASSRRDGENDGNKDKNYFIVRVTTRFVVLTLLSCTLLAFGIGRVAKMTIVKHEIEVLARLGMLSSSSSDIASGSHSHDPDHDGSYTARARPLPPPTTTMMMAALPDPVMKFGKLPPPTEYTSKTFDTSSSSAQSRWIVTHAGQTHDQNEQQHHHQSQERAARLLQEQDDDHQNGCIVDGDGGDANSCSAADPRTSSSTSAGTTSPSSTGETAAPVNESSPSPHHRYVVETNLGQHKHHQHDDDDQDDEDVEELHLPSGQHLLMDIEKVDPAFLNDESRLAIAMLELVNECGLTLLSYHCHKLKPMGVSCAGVLLESHVSFHTWPKEGVITLDLFTCGPNSLIPIVPVAERLFAIPNESASNHTDVLSEQPVMVWAHKYRGFYDNTTSDDIADLTDLQCFPLGMMTDYKKEIATAETDFQTIYIVDVLRPGFQSLDDYHKSISGDGSYQSLHPELFEPDRIVFLDGVLQSRRSGDAQYHETLVHPGMFAHPNPKRVAIVGGGEGATLREVLKHNTVETVFMIEIDEMMVSVSREFLPGWSDCRNVVGSTPNCFDDPRVELRHIDAFKWFVDSFPPDETKRTEEPFDVIIMDALDPQVQKDFVDALYDGGAFLTSLPNALSPQGILTAQVGEGSKLNDPPEELTRDRNRMKFVRSLSTLGFQSILEYNDDLHSGFFDTPWKIMVAFKDFNTRAEWFSNEARIELKIRQRIRPSKDGELLLRYFDGPLMQSSQYPKKTSEVVFCRGNPHVKECQEGHGFDPEREHIPISSLEVRQSGLGEHSGRGVYAAVDIPRMSYIGLDRLVPAVYADPHTFDLMDRGMNRIDWVYDHWWGETLEFYVNGYGHIFSFHGENEVFVDSTFQCFTNHACNGQNNVGFNISTSEATADPDVIAPEVHGLYFGLDRIYNPAAERQVHFYSTAIPLRDISKGEELLDTYIPMAGVSQKFWRESVTTLKSICTGAAGRTATYDRHAEERHLNSKNETS